MSRFLSDEWIAELDAAARASAQLDGVIPADAEIDELIVQQVILDPTEDRAFHLVLGRGPARALPGRAEMPTVTLTQSRATATAVARGTEAAQAAFMSGDLRIGGRVDLLLAHHGLLADLDDVFADVRARTEW